MEENRKVKIILAGDSTMQTYKDEAAPQAGWGQFLPNYFTKDVEIQNHAIGGRSSKSFVEEGRLSKALEELQENDLFFIQMGHNDSTQSKIERYTEPFTTYKQYLSLYCRGAQQKQAKAVFITPMARLHYVDGEFKNDFANYCMAMRQLAKQETIPLIDLMKKSLAYYQNIGYEEACSLFMASINGTDFTHFTQKGANEIAKLVVTGIKELDLPIAQFLLHNSSI